MDESHPWTSTGCLKASPGLPYVLWHQAGRYHYDEQRRGGEMRGKEKQKGLYAVERGETGSGEGWVDGGGLFATPGPG